MQQLRDGATLQGGKYRILSFLGQGGFGITYLAEQTMLERRVAVKEFFMKELCQRDGTTSRVTLGTEGSRATVSRYREKFIKEARNIAKLNHPNIIRIIDVFEENGTAYYVMEYCEHGSLASKVKAMGHIPEAEATSYIIQVAEALDYIHHRRMNHLDVKPGNIMLNEKDAAVLIDFGLSKQYNAAGNQTSTTPVGISEGYAPMEQYKQGGVGEFSPETDIYALGATYFKLLTGATPPSASDINEDGVPVDELKAKGVSQKAINVICKAMEPRKRDRMKDARSFIDGLQGEDLAEVDDEATVVAVDGEREGVEAEREAEAREKVESEREAAVESKRNVEPKKKGKSWTWSVIAVLVLLAAFFWLGDSDDSEPMPPTTNDTNSVYTPEERTFTANGVSFDMVEVRGGTFDMGATSEQGSEADDDEKPVHSVTLSSYYIGKTEVTQALWTAVMGKTITQIASENGWDTYGVGDNYPMYYISWNDCQTFISKLNSLTGKNFRLPTEAEWEFAARGGKNSKGYKYSGSNTLGNNVAWYTDNSGSKTHEVGTKSPNELGIYDMSGNVWEWCSDWYGSYSSSSQTNPTGSSSGTYRV